MELSDDYIKKYLGEIKQSIQGDVGFAIDAYLRSGQPVGHFAVLRMLLPEIDGLGSYLTGKRDDTTNNIKHYLSEIMVKIDERYNEFSSIIVKVYRHTLLHQHMPKTFTYDGQSYNWKIHLNDMHISTSSSWRLSHHLVFSHDNLFELSATTLYKDLVDSIDESFENLILTKYRETFNTAFNKQFEQSDIT